MKLNRKRRIIIPLTVISILIFTSLFASAASTKKILEAYYGVKIQYNGNILTSTNQPFIVNGSTYVPLRMIMDSFGDKSVQWDAANQKVIISNSTSNMEAVYMQQIISRNKQIEDLKKQIETLKNDNAYFKDQINNPDLDIEELEDDLDDKYEDYDNKNISISLDGDKDKIELTVKIDDSDWDDFSKSSKESFLDKICEDIWDEADDAEVEGEIKDGSKVLDSFEVKANKDVELEDFNDILETFENKMEEKYDDDWDEEGFNLRLYLSGDKDDIKYEIRINLSTYDDEWDRLSDTELRNLMDDLYDDIEDEYDNADVDGIVYDTSTSGNAATYNGSTLDRIIDAN